uniref:Uncharacterized protein n=1 Tax=Opuntia streptacantha TaxID=393608 RepID=A0A7C9E960_OPUST
MQNVIQLHPILDYKGRHERQSRSTNPGVYYELPKTKTSNCIHMSKLTHYSHNTGKRNMKHNSKQLNHLCEKPAQAFSKADMHNTCPINQKGFVPPCPTKLSN